MYIFSISTFQRQPHQLSKVVSCYTKMSKRIPGTGVTQVLVYAVRPAVEERLGGSSSWAMHLGVQVFFQENDLSLLSLTQTSGM